METKDKIMLGLSIWGGITGTIAIFRPMYHDRARLTVDAGMALWNSDHVVITVRAVNHGRRPLNIDRVAILCSDASIPAPVGMPPDKLAEFQALQKSVSSMAKEICIFGDQNNPSSVDVSPDGGEKTFSSPWFASDPGFSYKMRKGDKVGRGYVRLTSGKKVFFDFCMLNEGAWQLISQRMETERSQP